MTFSPACVQASTLIGALLSVLGIVERHGVSVWAEGRPGQVASSYVGLRTAHAR